MCARERDVERESVCVREGERECVCARKRKGEREGGRDLVGKDQTGWIYALRLGLAPAISGLGSGVRI